MNKLNWYLATVDYMGNAREYRAIFKAKITDSISFYITYDVFMDNADEWYLNIIQVSPNPLSKIISIKCYDPETGKKMAEDKLKEIFDGMKKFLEKYKEN